MTNFLPIIAKLFQNIISSYNSNAIIRGNNETPQFKELASNLEKISNQLVYINQGIRDLVKETAKVSDTMIFVAKHGKSLEAEAHLENALLALAADVIDVAIKELKKSEELNPTSHELWTGYAMLHCRLLSMNHDIQAISLPDTNDVLIKAVKFTLQTDAIDRQARIQVLLSILGASLILGRCDIQDTIIKSITKLFFCDNKLDDCKRKVVAKSLLVNLKNNKLKASLDDINSWYSRAYHANVTEFKRKLSNDMYNLYEIGYSTSNLLEIINNDIKDIYVTNQMISINKIVKSYEAMSVQLKQLNKLKFNMELCENNMREVPYHNLKYSILMTLILIFLVSIIFIQPGIIRLTSLVIASILFLLVCFKWLVKWRKLTAIAKESLREHTVFLSEHDLLKNELKAQISKLQVELENC